MSTHYNLRETHQHLDIFPKLEVPTFLNLQQNLIEAKLCFYDHNFNHHLLNDSILKSLHGVEPEQHLSIAKNAFTKLGDMRNCAEKLLLITNQTLGYGLPPNDLYSEYEFVNLNELPPNINPKFPERPLFEASKEKIEIDWNENEKPLYEIHVPIELQTLRTDANIWLKTGFTGVTRRKADGKDYVILTGLSADRALFQNLFKNLTEAGYRATFEQKYYITNLGAKTHNLITDVRY